MPEELPFGSPELFGVLEPGEEFDVPEDAPEPAVPEDDPGSDDV